jgi:hypothetical protein
MRTASLVLGIIGGVLAIIFAVISFFIGTAANVALDELEDINISDIDGMEDLDDFQILIEDENVHIDGSVDLDEPLQFAGRFAGSFVGALFWIPAILSLIGGVLGIVGAALTRKKNVIAGVLMIIAAVLCLFTVVGFISTILFVLGGIFALINDKSAQAPVPPPQPPAAQA